MGLALTVSSAARADPVNIVTSGFYSVVWDEESDFRFLGTGFEVIGLPNSSERSFGDDWWTTLTGVGRQTPRQSNPLSCWRREWES
jgi:hypothetical protein